MQLLVILRDLSQVKIRYRTYCLTLANAGMVQMFSPSDAETLQFASTATGDVRLSRLTISLNVRSNDWTSRST